MIEVRWLKYFDPHMSRQHQHIPVPITATISIMLNIDNVEKQDVCAIYITFHNSLVKNTCMQGNEHTDTITAFYRSQHSADHAILIDKNMQPSFVILNDAVLSTAAAEGQAVR
jgi:hypothetical protein